jgi:transposase-like protein
MPDLPMETWAQIRHDYEHSERAIQDICAEHGISSGTLRDRVRRWHWTRRRAPIAAKGPPPAAAPPIEYAPPSPTVAPQSATAVPSPPAAPLRELAPLAPAAPETAPDEDDEPPEADPALIVVRLRSAVARVLPAIEAILATLGAAHTPPREMERAARALSSLTRTLRELNALLSQHHASAEDDSAENLDAFRHELARRIEFLRLQHEAKAAKDAGSIAAEAIEPEAARAESAPSMRQL